MRTVEGLEAELKRVQRHADNLAQELCARAKMEQDLIDAKKIESANATADVVADEYLGGSRPSVWIKAFESRLKTLHIRIEVYTE